MMFNYKAFELIVAMAIHVILLYRTLFHGLIFMVYIGCYTSI